MHSYASHLMMKGVYIRTAQKLLGHHSIKMTEQYSHLAPDRLQSVANYLDFEKTGEIFGHKLGTNRIFLIPGFLQIVDIQKCTNRTILELFSDLTKIRRFLRIF